MYFRFGGVSTLQALFGAFLFAVFLVAVPRSGVAQDPPSVTDRDKGPTSLSVGTLSTSFTFGGDGRYGLYNYNKSTRALMVSGPNGSLLLDYASGLETGQFSRDARRTIGAEALFGGNAYLFEEFLLLPLDIYVPIRLNLDYRYVQPRDPEVKNLHRGAAGLGAGGGAQLQLPVGPDFIKENLYVRGSAVIVPAVATSLGGGNEEDAFAGSADEPPLSASRTRMRRTFNINLEALFTELLSENTGVMVGYTFRTYDRSREKPSSVGDVIDAATLRGEYKQTNVQHMVRIGLSW